MIYFVSKFPIDGLPLWTIFLLKRMKQNYIAIVNVAIACNASPFNDPYSIASMLKSIKWEENFN